VPVFCFDDRLLRGRHASGPRTQFLLECLAELDERTGGLLVVRRGPPERELPALAREANATALHFTADSGPFARRRIERVVGAMDIECVGHPGLHAVDDLDAIRTQAGAPYTVFSPFYRTWQAEPRRAVIGRPRELGPLPRGVTKGTLPTLRELGLEQEVSEPLRGGETAARERLAAFLRDGVGTYVDDHDALGSDRTSRLSPYLHFGCLSPREVEQRLPRGAGSEAFQRQLCWRDFYHHVLLHFPRNAHSEFQARYRGDGLEPRLARDRGVVRGPHRLPARGRRDAPAAARGLDAQPRAARRRLVPDQGLGIDWRWGDGSFMRLLIDGDEANNNGNWQWIASVGVDPQPAFRRIYNPARHMERYDPGRPLRAPLRARAARRADRVPCRAVDDARGRCSATSAA
jgi:deoxyribodipyrimidine photo-lyase